ncbi:MAG TPA: hypothetical protein VEK80_07930, partial [Kribbellaceae bacterium]|nr:hypothetical protein [Kribbellaceae bacterium]
MNTLPIEASAERARAINPSDIPRPRAIYDQAWRTGASVRTSHAGVTAVRRRRRPRSWMLSAPVDLAALLAPLLLTHEYWRGTLFTAGLTMVIIA